MARALVWVVPLLLQVAAGVSCGEAQPQRLLWEVAATRFAGRPQELVPAGDKLLVFAGGVLYALEAGTGRECWHYPPQGIAFDPGVVPVYILNVLDDQVIVRLSRKEGRWSQGCEALGLADGAPKRSLSLKDFRNGTATGSYLRGTELVLWDRKQEGQTEVAVLDIRKWAEVARFTLPEIRHDLEAQDGKVYGILKRKAEIFERCFTVDLKEGVLYSLPLRQQHHLRFPRLDPDGTRHYRDGAFDAKCAYLGLREEKDPFVDRCVPVRPWPSGLYVNLCARSKTVHVKAAGAILYVADAQGGAWRAVIRALDDPGPEQDPVLNRAALAADDERVYFGWPGGLRAVAGARGARERRPGWGARRAARYRRVAPVAAFAARRGGGVALAAVASPSRPVLARALAGAARK